jgi:putative long chain acyl-CoA synthase
VEERRRREGDQILLMFEDRGYTASEVGERIDNVVSGLISIGVRQGEHVGVLMSTRPSVLSVVIALSRVGAVSVLLRPDGDLAREAALGQVQRIIADPEHALSAAGLEGPQTFVLGGGGGERDLEIPDAVDMEQIDVERIELPGWYRPNPGRASELAFIVFTGEGANTRMSRITNRRWAQSAFGTASSAALSSADTLYSLTPVHHPSGLMMSIGGAIAGGARLALARDFRPETFWEEARRYGATVASYTWTLLHDLVEAPPNPGERHHPVRLFIGSGMPRGMWRRVEERFSPARVLEFYASTEAGAIIVNVRGAKPGAMGRPLPGSAEVRIAAFELGAGDPDAPVDGLIAGADGFVLEAGVDEVGMLVAKVDPTAPLSVVPLRGLFAREDAWLLTGDLFRRDADGDFWRVDSLGDVIRTAHGPVFAGPIRDALADLPAVDLAVAYGVVPDGGEDEIAVAAVTARHGRTVLVRDVTEALRLLPRDQRPAIVQVMERIPVTTWFRPLTDQLRAAGIPAAEDGVEAWYRSPRADGYRRLTAETRSQLLHPAS